MFISTQDAPPVHPEFLVLPMKVFFPCWETCRWPFAHSIKRRGKQKTLRLAFKWRILIFLLCLSVSCILPFYKNDRSFTFYELIKSSHFSHFHRWDICNGLIFYPIFFMGLYWPLFLYFCVCYSIIQFFFFLSLPGPGGEPGIFCFSFIFSQLSSA